MSNKFQLTEKFKLIDSGVIEEYKATLETYEHIKTGAKVIALKNDDINNTFAISFATPSYGSTGVAHILEHSVLCGTEKYPVKELFGELIKGSLNTFVNALTYYDHTCYPFGTTNSKDFLNLQRAYLEAVFCPLLTEDIFRQEGWHLELDKENDKLSYKGVVFNEMKGVYSDPNSHIEEMLLTSIFPDTIYAKDSGGDPQIIPELTYEKFKAFYTNYYHPSNATIVLTGNAIDANRFELLDEYLSKYEKSLIATFANSFEIPLELKNVEKSIIAMQKPFQTRKSLTYPYPEKEKAAIFFTFVDDMATNREKLIELEILNRLLTANSTSPLRKALEESNLGEEFVGMASIDPTYQILLYNGLKGVKSENLEAVEKLYFDTLNQVADVGFDQLDITATLNKYEFDQAEINFGYDRFPSGLKFSDRIISSVMFGGDAVESIQFANYLKNISAKLETNPNYFVNLLKSSILDNQFSSIVKYLPQADMLETINQKEVIKLESIKQNLSETGLEKLIQTQERLLKWQQTPDSAETLALIPVLEISDLEHIEKPNLIQVLEPNLLLTDINTNSIVYLDLVFDLQVLPLEFIPLLPLFMESLGEVETLNYPIDKLQREIDLNVGEIDNDLIINTDYNGNLISKVIISSKFLVSKTQGAIDLVLEILNNSKLDNQSKVLQLIAQSKSAIENSLIPEGHRTILRYLNSNLNPENYLTDQISSYTQLQFLKNLEVEAKDNWSSVLEKLQTIKSHLFAKDNVLINVTLDQKNFEERKAIFETIASKLPTVKTQKQSWNFELKPENKNLELPAQVGYAAQSYKITGPNWFEGSFYVASSHLRMDYLWNNVRIQGGAYGCFSLPNPKTGVYSFVTYRDPTPLKSLEVFDKAVEYLKSVNLDKADLKKLIIGVFGDLDAYLTPEEVGLRELNRFLTGQTQEYRQRIRDQVLATTNQDIQKLGLVLEAHQASKIQGVLGKQA